MRWLKANVRRYGELSSAIREDYCHHLDFKKDRAKGKKSMAIVRGAHKRERQRSFKLNKVFPIKSGLQRTF